MALVTRVAMGTLNNRRNCQNFSEIHQKCDPSMQYCNGKEKQSRNPGSTLNFNFSREFLFSGEIRIEKVDERGKVWH